MPAQTPTAQEQMRIVLRATLAIPYARKCAESCNYETLTQSEARNASLHYTLVYRAACLTCKVSKFVLSTELVPAELAVKLETFVAEGLCGTVKLAIHRDLTFRGVCMRMQTPARQVSLRRGLRWGICGTALRPETHVHRQRRAQQRKNSVDNGLRCAGHSVLQKVRK